MGSLKQKLNYQHWKMIAIILAIYDFIAVFCSYTLALLLRFDFRFSQIPARYWNKHLEIIFIYCAVCLLIFFIFRLYHSLWRFASYYELIRGFFATAVSIALLVSSEFWYYRMPISYYVFGGVAQFCSIVGMRFAYRLINLIRSRDSRSYLKHRVGIYGAGDAGLTLARNIMNGGNNREDKVLCFFDDNPNKHGRYIENIPVHGGRDSVFEAVEKYKLDRIYFAIPAASAQQRRDILQILNESGCSVKQIPGLHQLVNGEVSVNVLRDVPIEDLLGRDPIEADMSGVYNFIHGKTVLITGGGGSIGSELCRQVAAHGPARLIIFDVYENNAYGIQMELRDKYPQMALETVIGSVRDSARLNEVFARYRPDVVYHAAAHKHVPLMEDSPCESIKNNVLGTYKCCWAALHYGTKRFVLISTDKAVNPTNIMGASKRLCEMVVQTFDDAVRNNKTDALAELSGLTAFDGIAVPDEKIPDEPQTQFVAVRFGNVLGSNGSVIPVFKKQIEKGGPVTVTDPEIIRYFMTIPEAVSLVMLAGTYAKGGEIFVLDMGSPVKIDTLARNLIRLSGLKPDTDIKIEYTGLRKGEKLYEEKLMAEEGLEKTENRLIHIGKPIAFDHDVFLAGLKELAAQAYQNNEDGIRDFVRELVSTYHPELGAKPECK